MTFKAKDKATQDLELIDSMRRSLGAAGLVVVFETWRDYVKTKRQRERRDLEKKYELEVKSFATAMQSVQIAQVRVCVDCYVMVQGSLFFSRPVLAVAATATDGVNVSAPDSNLTTPTLCVCMCTCICTCTCTPRSTTCRCGRSAWTCTTTASSGATTKPARYVSPYAAGRGMQRCLE